VCGVYVCVCARVVCGRARVCVVCMCVRARGVCVCVCVSTTALFHVSSNLSSTNDRLFEAINS
jgi:hypothetical protein